jgi:hypothetical protein
MFSVDILNASRVTSSMVITTFTNLNLLYNQGGIIYHKPATTCVHTEKNLPINTTHRKISNIVALNGKQSSQVDELVDTCVIEDVVPS